MFPVYGVTHVPGCSALSLHPLIVVIEGQQLLHNFVESLLPTVTVDNILEGEKPDAIGECRPILPAPRLQNRVLSDYEPSGSELQGRLLGNLDPEIVEENSLG